MTTAPTADPFALIIDPARVRARIERSEQLTGLRRRRCHPLDRAEIRCASAEVAAYDARIDRSTTYLPPEGDRRDG